MSDDGGDTVAVSQGLCDWCSSEGVALTHKLDLDRFSVPARFCSLECAARWGSAADQSEIEEVVTN